MESKDCCMLSEQVSDLHKYTYVVCMYLWMGRAMYSDVGKCPAEDTCMMSRPDENVRLVRRRRDDVSSLQSTYLRQDQGSKKGSKVETEKQHLC